MVRLTITIPDEVYARLKRESEQSSRAVEDVVTETIITTYPADEAQPSRRLEQTEERGQLRETLSRAFTPVDVTDHLATLQITPGTKAETECALEKFAALDISPTQVLIDLRDAERA
jgi:hypothetical protein